MADEEFDSEDSIDSDTEDSDSESDDEPINEKITLKARKDRRSIGKWKLLSDNKKVFKKEWMDIFPWVDEDPRDPQSAFCKVCNKSIKAIKGALHTHQKTKKHVRNLAGPAEEVEEPEITNEQHDEHSNEYSNEYSNEHNIEHNIEHNNDDRFEPRPAAAIGIDQITDEQISYFAESQADAAHQAVTSIIDKLVERYHENRLRNLKVQNDAVFELNVERAKLIRSENQRKLERRLQQEAYMKEAEETRLKFLQAQHETKIHAMEDERDAKLRAVEQELVFAKQEYEKKVRLLDSQLSSMK